MSAARRLQEHRHHAGLTQAELARRAGVSRALVSAVEAGRHLPRVDAAIALAEALGTSAERLFADAEPDPVDALSGDPPAPGTPVRTGLVGDRLVTAAPRLGGDGWEVIDGTIGSLDRALLLSGPSLVVAGCEPALVLIERILREHGTRALAIGASSASALAALAAGRLHAAAVHFPHETPPAHDLGALERIHVARWRVGLAAPSGSKRRWWSEALRGARPVIQRERGAAAQCAFERAARTKRPIEGPRASGHLAASRLSVATGLPAVTIEPAAAAVGAAFHPLETHDVELWIPSDRAAEPGVGRLLDLLSSAPFRRTLESIGAYDLGGSGRRVS